MMADRQKKTFQFKISITFKKNNFSPSDTPLDLVFQPLRR